MAGTTAGGKKTYQRLGSEHFRRMGKAGGSKSRGGGFTGDKERAREAGAKGGRASAPYSVNPKVAAE